MKMKYCDSYTLYKRFPAHEVQIGNIKMGAEHPIVVQSMVNTDTMDTAATVQQVKELVDAGCELVRITAPGVKDAENLRAIKAELHRQGIFVPLVADIHFAPKAADIAAAIVDKVRINPGNYVDKKVFKSFEYTDEAYQDELLRIEAKFIPFLDICKAHNTAVRIGSNHGSLSDRIVNKYGNTPEGMVEAAMEFLRICQKENFKNVVVSMKASNTQIMTQSTRLLAAKMRAEDMGFPIHLGVTEAGNGEEGRIKSSIGIGALLSDGIGDTIRVSLTEHPKAEIPVAEAIVKHYQNIEKAPLLEDLQEEIFNPYLFQKRMSKEIQNIGGSKTAVVLAHTKDAKTKETIKNWGESHPDYIVVDSASEITNADHKYILEASRFSELKEKENCFPLLQLEELMALNEPISKLQFIECTSDSLKDNFKQSGLKDKLKTWDVVLILKVEHDHSVAEQRQFFKMLKQEAIDNPVILKRNYKEQANLGISAACDLGPMFTDGFGDGIWVDGSESPIKNTEIAFNILQGARVRMFKTEFISCPSCGRTLFDLESTTEEIKKRLSHLKHLKIGVMGCVVNGPGEMADADYGYVGSGKGKISLYKGQTVVRRNIPSGQAVDDLIELIKENGDWMAEEAAK